jgi:sugar lactone lactonase YvrE
MLAIPVVSAEFGDEVTGFNFTPTPAGNGRAVAYDGTDLYYTYFGNNSIFRVATDGTAIDSYDTGVQIGALSWDASRGKLWAGAYDTTGKVYLVDYGVGKTEEFTFNITSDHFSGYIDGLAYDTSDDTLWMSEDWGHTVYHVDTDGTPLGNWVINLGDNESFDNSGIELVCGTYLFLANPGIDTTHGPNANGIYVFEKDGTYTGMSIDTGINLVEGLAFGDYVLWINNAGTNKIVAYDIATIGDEVASFTPAPAGNGRAVAYDGTDLYYTYYLGPGSDSIYRVATDNTTIDSLYTGMQIGALSWDASRGKLWAGAYNGSGYVYLIDYAAGTIDYQFTFAGGTAHFAGFIDGLAWDASDDTLWMSEDWDHAVYHVATNGTILGNWPIDLGNGALFDNSGIEVVCDTYLFLASPNDTTHGPNANGIYVFEKDGTYTGMSIDTGINLVEDLAFGDWVLWINNVQNKLVAYDVLDDLKRFICPIEVEKHFTYTNVEFTPYELRTYTQIKNSTTDPDGPWGDLFGLNNGIYSVSWNHTIDSPLNGITSATLEIWHYDVDDSEHDTVYVDGVNEGLLTQGTGSDAVNKTVITLSNLTDLDDGIIFIDVDIEFNWFVAIENSTLSVEYLEQQPAELGTPLDEVKMVIHKNGKVKSTNPGQLYSVITITGPIEDFNFTDYFDDEFNVNPAHLGGGVEIILVDPNGYATILTEDPGVTATVDNTANYVMGSVDLDEMLKPGYRLMIYIKFKTSMKHQQYTGDDVFDNYGYIYDLEWEDMHWFEAGLPIVQ